ncbi:MAG: AMP-binding protein, partial [Pseudomonadota bacterium]
MQTLHHGVWPEGRPHSLEVPRRSVFQNLVEAAERDPTRTAINYYGSPLSYRDLLADVKRLAGYLSKVAKVRPNDRVAICLQNSPQFVIAYYAVLAANAVVVPITPLSRRAELEHVFSDAEVKAVIFGAELGPVIEAVWPSCGRPALISVRYSDHLTDPTSWPVPETVTQQAGHSIGVPWLDTFSGDHTAPVHDRGPDDWCLIPYSSGTTGRPKGCLHTHGSVNFTLHAYPVWFALPSGSRYLATLPFYHVAGMQNSMNLPILTASTVYPLTRWDPGLALRLIEEERIEQWRSITTSMIDLLSLPETEDADLSSLAGIGGGGAQIPESIAQKMSDLIGLEFIEAYGLTETIAPTHINPPGASKKQCLGIPIFDVDCRVIDPDTLVELGPGETGEIVTHGPQLMREYWRLPDETTAAFTHFDGKRFFRTGDLGYYDAQGYFFFVDRLKRMINVSGQTFRPET